MDFSNLIKGIYIIEIENGGTTVHKKLIKES
ncbi:T9SS type A sorting domain-containing protein [Chryseobacterium sp. MA9]